MKLKKNQKINSIIICIIILYKLSFDIRYRFVKLDIKDWLNMGNAKKWYAVYTKSRAEKKVSESLRENGIEEFLPLVKTLRQWSDRKKQITVPLFNSYIFVHIDLSERENVLRTNGVVCFVTIGKELIPIPENQIHAIHEYLKQDIQQLVDFNYEEGQRVRIDRGVMKGLEGTIANANGIHKLRIKIEAVNQYITLTIAKNLLRPVSISQPATVE